VGAFLPWLGSFLSLLWAGANQNCNVKSMARFTLYLWILGWAATSSPAAFTSLYVFGDGVSTTTNSPGGSFFYGKRYCNGRVWVEVLAQWQGLNYESNKNWSYFGHDSVALTANLNNFPVPADAASALFVVWVINADFVYDIQNYRPYTSNNIAVWNNAIGQSLTNHVRAITNLYAKGARTLVLPGAADITKVPEYPGLSASEKNFIRQRIISFNAAYTNTVSNLLPSLPNLKIYLPDVFTLLDNVLAQPKNCGFTNVGSAIDAGYTSFTGPGTNYVFWDYLHPTAKLQMMIADLTQQLISPVKFSQITALDGTNRLELVNVPIGRNGFVDGSTNCLNWAAAVGFTSSNLSQSVFVPASGPWQCYRLRFPFAWSWP